LAAHPPHVVHSVKFVLWIVEAIEVKIGPVVGACPRNRKGGRGVQETLRLPAGGYEELMKPGTKVEVRSRFDQRWGRGFEIAEVEGEGYRIRRLSDGEVLPVVFTGDDVRKERKKQGLWWY
jgi:hypothetical protein